MTQDQINEELQRAVMTGTADDVLEALGKGADLFMKDAKGNSLLATAAFKRNFETFDILLEVSKGGKKIDINEFNYAGQNLLMSIIHSGSDFKFIEKLIEVGVDINAYNDVNMPPLMYALAHEDMELFQLLIDKGANVNVKLAETQADPLLMLTTTTTSKDMHKMCKMLIDAGADVNTQDRNGRTPLMNLTLRNKSFMKEHEIKSVKETEYMLINHPSFNVNVKDNGGGDLLFYMLAEGEYSNNVRKLIDLGAKIDVWQDIFLGKNVKTSSAHLLMNIASRKSREFEAKSKAEEKAAKAAQNSNPQSNAKNNINANSAWGNPLAPMMNTIGQEDADNGPKNVDELYADIMKLYNNENIDVTKKNSIGNSIAAIALTGSHDFVNLWLNDNNPIADEIFEFDRASGELQQVSILNIWVNREASSELIERFLNLGIKKTYANDTDELIKDKEPLFSAITTLNVNVVNLLLQHGVNPNEELKIMREGEYYSPMRIFASGIIDGSYNKALSELRNQKNIKKAYEENEANGVENDKITPEQYQKICENIETLEKVSEQVDQMRMQILSELLSAGADINLLDKNNRTPIFYANDEKTYELMKNFGADVFAENEKGENYLLYLLTKTNKAKIIDLVVQEYKDMKHPLGERPFYELAFNEDAVNSHQVSQIMLSNMVNLLNPTEQEHLMHNRKLESLKDNLEKIKKRLETQKQPSAFSVNQKFIDSLEKDIETLSNKIIELGEPKEITVSGANYQDENGNSPLLIASAMENTPLVSFLLEIGGDVNLENNAKETPIMHAISTNNYRLVEFLIEKGADVTAQTEEGKSVLDFAKEMENPDILEAIMCKLDPSLKEGEVSNRRTLRI